MTVICSLEALFDLADLRDYIAEDNPDAARRVAIAIVQTVDEGLAMNPKLGHPGRVPGTREYPICRGLTAETAPRDQRRPTGTPSADEIGLHVLQRLYG